MNEIVISDSGVIRQVLRDLTEAEAPRVAQILAAYVDKATDGVMDGTEYAYWLSKARYAIEHGVARGFYVNGGAVCGAYLALPDVANPGRAILLTAQSMWDAERAVPAMRADARRVATAIGMQLVERVTRVEWVPV